MRLAITNMGPWRGAVTLATAPHQRLCNLAIPHRRPLFADAGEVLLGVSTLAFQAHLLSPLVWMILTGAGLYMAYTPFNAMLFDRMIAFSGQIGTAGFLIYVGDASGYLGSIALLVWRNFAMVRLDWLGFFIASAYATSVVGAVCTILAGLYFLRRRPAAAAHVPTAVAAEDARA